MSTEPAADLVLTHLRALVHRARRVKQEVATGVHPQLHGAAWTLLAFLIEDGPTRASCIARRLEVPPSVVTRQADELEQLGLLERLPDPDDGRARLLAATEAARRRCGDEPRPYRRLMRDLLVDWDVEDVETLGRLLGRLVAATAEVPPTPRVDRAEAGEACSAAVPA